MAAPETQSASISSPPDAGSSGGSGARGDGAERTWGDVFPVLSIRRGTDRARVRACFKKIGQAVHRGSGNRCIVVQKQDVLPVGGAKTDIERLGEAEVFR